MNFIVFTARSQPMNDCRNKRGLNESFAEFDSTEDEKKILRVPQEYVLRVLNGGGALIREHCEIECSRAVLAASPGKIYSSIPLILIPPIVFLSVLPSILPSFLIFLPFLSLLLYLNLAFFTLP